MSHARLRSIWQNMKQRCFNPNKPEFRYYGGRGILVCERWMSFNAFANDVGEPPTALHQLDRIDNDGPYDPENVRWATAAENNLNTRANVFLEHDGRRMTITEWERVLQMKKGTLKRRIQRGWRVSEALTTPVEEDPLYTFKGQTRNLSEWARSLKQEHSMLFARLHKGGMSVQEAFTQPRRQRTRKKH